MKRKVGEIWKEQEGSKIIWKVKFPKGIGFFYTKKVAMRWVEQLKKDGLYECEI